MIHPITDAFNNYNIGTNFGEFLMNPLIEGLKKIQNESLYANDLIISQYLLGKFLRLIIKIIMKIFKKKLLSLKIDTILSLKFLF
jgi:hypothetical protein